MIREQFLRWTHGIDSRDSGADIRLGASTNPGSSRERDFNAFRSDGEIVDVTIPSEVFDERRMYEIAVSVDLTSVESGVERDHRRYALYHGGYKRPDRPCAETSIEQGMTRAER